MTTPATIGTILAALTAGDLSTEQATEQAKGISWAPQPRSGPAPTSGIEALGAAETEDPPTVEPGSFDEVKMAFMRGQITKEQYAAFYEVWLSAKPS